MQGLLEILEAVAEETVNSTYDESGSRSKLFHELQTVTRIVAECKFGDSQNKESSKEIFKHLHKTTGVPISKITNVFANRKAIIGDLQILRFENMTCYLLNCYPNHIFS